MAGMGEVKVSLVVDDSKARQTVQGFFDSIGQEKIADPFKGLDKSIQAIEKQAKQLGVTWDNTSKTFKDQSGASKTIQEVGRAIDKVDGEAKAMGKSFGEVANQFKSFNSAAGNAAKGVKGFGSLIKDTGTQIKGAQFTQLGQQLKKLGTDATSAGTGFKQLSTDAKSATTELKGIGTGTAAGIKNIGTEAKNAAQGLQNLGKNSETTATGLKNIGQSSQSLKGVGTIIKGTSDSIKSLGTQSVATAASIKSVTDNGKGLNTLGTSAKKVGSDMKAASTGAAALGVKIKSLGQAAPGVKNLGNAVTGLGTASRGASTAFGSLGAAITSANQKAKPLSALPQKIKPINGALKSAGTAAQGMGDKLEEAGKEGGNMADSIVGGFQQILNGIPQGIGMALGNALLAPLKAIVQIVPQAVNEFRALDESLRLTLEISGAGAQKFGELKDAILAVSSTSAATGSEVAAVAQSLSRAGFSLDEVKAAMEGVVKGAEATGTSYEAMGDIVVSALGAFQMEASTAGDVADSLTVAANNSNQSVTDLGDALKYVGPVANAVGQELDDVNLALGLLANAGIRASTAGTSLRTLLTNLKIAAGGAGEEFTSLSRGNKRFATALQLVGATVTDVNGELLPMEQLLLNLQTGFNKLTSAEQTFISKALVGQEGLSSFSALMKSSSGDIQEFADNLENKAGTALEQANNAMQGLAGSFKFLESAASAALAEIGGMIATVLKPLVDIATGIINLFNQLPGPLKALLGAVTALSVGIGVLTAAMALMESAAIAAFAGKVITAIQNFTSALNAANAAKAFSLMLDKATALTNALNGGLTGALGKGSQALKKFASSVKAKGILTTLTEGSKGATAGITGLVKATAPAAGTLGKMGVTAGQAAAATAQMGTSFTTAAPAAQAMMVKSGLLAGTLKGVGVSSGASVVGVKALGASLLGLSATVLPIAAIVGGVVLAVKGVMDYYGKWKEVSSELESTTKTLNEALKEANITTEETAEKSDYAGRAVDTLKGKYSSWGKSVEGTLGPLDRFAGLMLGPMWGGLKRGIDLLGQVDEANKMRIMVAGLNDEHAAFEQAMDKTNKKLEENNQKLLTLNPASEEYGKILGQNQVLQNASINATTARIEKIDELIKKYSEEEGANSQIVKALQKQKGELQGVLAQQELQKAAMDELATKYKESTGEVASHITEIQRLQQEQAKLQEIYNNEALLNEVALRQKVKDGVISEAEAKAAAAGAALKLNQDIIKSENKRMKALDEAYAAGEITESDYVSKKKELVGEIKEKIKEAIDAEDDYTEAVREAVNARLDEYIRAQQGVAAYADKVNSILSGLTSIGTSGIEAYKNLANTVTQGRLQEIDKVKSKELASIEKQKAARLRMIDNSSLSDQAKTKAKEAAEKQFMERKEAAERKAEQDRMKAMQAQIAFEEAAHQNSMGFKRAQLELDRASAAIQNRLLIAQTQYEQMKAKNDGATDEQLAAYDDMIGLLKTNEQIIQKQFDLKQKILDVEDLTGQAAIANKAAAEGVNTAFSNTPASLNEIQSSMNSMVGEIVSLADSVPTLFDQTAIEIDKVEGIAAETIQRIEGAWNEFDPATARENLSSIFGPEMGREMAVQLTSHIETATTTAGEAGKANLQSFFGDSIPYELIKDPLVNALSDGTEEGTAAAKEKVSVLGETGFIPTDQIATILGDALGVGYEGGLQALQAMPLPDNLQVYQDLIDGLGNAGIEGMEKAGSEGGSTLKELTTAAGNDAAGNWGEAFGGFVANFQEQWNGTLGTIQDAWKGLFDGGVDTTSLQTDVEEALVTPITEAQEALGGLAVPEGLGSNLEGAAGDVDKMANSGLKTEMSGAATQSSQLKSNASGAAGSIRSMVGTSRQVASNMERAANAAARAARQKFAGGPVQGGGSYTVNELGSEMFMSNSGKLSEIKAPAFGNWRAPSDGTIIPAHISNDIRNAQAAMDVNMDLRGGGDSGAASARRSEKVASSGPNYQRQMVKELRNLGNATGGTVNNVTVTSDRPVGDAQRLLLEVQRLNRFRKR